MTASDESRMNGPGDARQDRPDGIFVDQLDRLARQMTALRECLLDAAAHPLLRVTDFRRRRLDALARGETPVQLRQGPALVLHLLPQAAFERWAAPVNLEAAEFLIFGTGGSPTYNADGKLMWPEDRRMLEQRRYAQLGRTGWIEAATVLRDPEPSASTLHVRPIEKLLIQGAADYLGLLVKLELIGPLQLVATLTRMKGNLLTSDGYYDTATVPVATDELALPVVSLPASTIPPGEVPKALRPALDALWQVRGSARCPHFNDAGEYQPR